MLTTGQSAERKAPGRPQANAAACVRRRGTGSVHRFGAVGSGPSQPQDGRPSAGECRATAQSAPCTLQPPSGVRSRPPAPQRSRCGVLHRRRSRVPLLLSPWPGSALAWRAPPAMPRCPRRPVGTHGWRVPSDRERHLRWRCATPGLPPTWSSPSVLPRRAALVARGPEREDSAPSPAPSPAPGPSSPAPSPPPRLQPPPPPSPSPSPQPLP